MTVLTWTTCLAGLGLGPAVACQDDDTDNNGADSDPGADGETDSDADSDPDTDSGGDTDGNGDGDTDEDDGDWIEHPIDDMTSASIGRLADLDQDGNLDILYFGGVADRQDGLAWLRNTAGDGSSWTVNLVEEVSMKLDNLYIVDLDGDNDLDIIGHIATDTFSHEVVWWENADGNGSAWTRHSIYVNDELGSNRPITADIDGDGDVDIAGTGGPQLDTRVVWWTNTDGDGLTWEERTVAEGFDFGLSVAAADLDGDGDIDLAGTEALGEEFSWWENQTGDGSSWVHHAIVEEGENPFTIAAVDLDQDGDDDILATANKRIEWWENSGDGSFADEVVDSTWGDANRDSYSVFAADLGQDGNLDVVAEFASEGIGWWENHPDRSGWTRRMLGCASSEEDQRIRVGDIDGDGDKDVFVMESTNSSGKTVWCENNGVQRQSGE